MYLETSFWSKEKVQFDHILFIDRRDMGVIFEVSFKEHKLKIKDFFKKVIKYNLKERNDNAQFAVRDSNDILPICWFDLVLDNGNVISRDYAFHTDLIQFNGIDIPFGTFPPFEEKGMLPKRIKYLWSDRRERKVCKQALTFIANKV